LLDFGRDRIIGSRSVEVATESLHNEDRDLADSGLQAVWLMGEAAKRRLLLPGTDQKIVAIIADEKGYGKSL
jgi:hypothetical protein